MDNLLFSLNATLPIFLVMLLGKLLGWLGFLPRAFCSAADTLVFKITLPTMLFLNMASLDLAHDFKGSFVLFCMAATAAAILVIWALARLLLRDKSMTGEFVQACYRSSAAVLGVAFIQNMYGSSGMAPLMILGSVPLFNIFAVLILTLENPAATAKVTAKQLLKGVVTNPIILGIALGTLYSLLPFGLPVMVQKTLSSISSLTTPLALLSIGACFEGAKAIKKVAPTLAAATCKLVVLSGIFMPLAVWLGFRNQELIALLVMLGSPTTPSSYVMAKSMGHEGVLSASCIAATTLLSALSLTAWIYLLRTAGYITAG